MLAAVAMVLVTAALASAALASGRGVRAHASRACARADRTHLAVGRFLTVLRCLHNRERSAHGLRRLRRNGKLARAARGHAADMARAHYFGHTSPNGASPLTRALSAGYRGRRVSVGENIVYVASTRGVTPREVMRLWMGSPPHRRNILTRRWRHLGIGAVRRSPSGQRGITVVAEFGVRR